MIVLKSKDNFSKAKKRLGKLLDTDITQILMKYGERGVQMLKDATPVRTGKTAESWYYEIIKGERQNTVSLSFLNSNINDGVNIAILIQYGHGTKLGKYVEGIDYINPVIDELYKEMAKDISAQIISKSL